MVRAIDKPMALHKEYLPPTQSQNSNMFFLSIPKFTTSLSLVERAAKCLAICFSSFAFFRNHCLAVWAFVIVSCVVKVLEAIRKRGLSGFTFFNVSAICVPSTFETRKG